MKFYFIILLLLSGLFFFGCSNCDVTKNGNNLEKQTKNIREVATEKFGRDYKILNNKSATFAICLNEKNRLKAAEVNRISYFIFDIKNSEIIFEDSLSNSNVGWETDNLITVTRIPGMIKKDSENKLGNKVYSFDVVTKGKN